MLKGVHVQYWTEFCKIPYVHDKKTELSKNTQLTCWFLPPLMMLVMPNDFCTLNGHILFSCWRFPTFSRPEVTCAICCCGNQPVVDTDVNNGLSFCLLSFIFLLSSILSLWNSNCLLIYQSARSKLCQCKQPYHKHQLAFQIPV